MGHTIALTGARQHVGNYPGVTVEKKTGVYRIENRAFSLVDLPGTYSMTAYSMEEIIARDYLATEKPSVVVNIVDAANLERNLYLTLQLIEMGMPVCIALNMMDVAEGRGIRIDIARLSELLGVPVIPTVARSGKGKRKLMAAAAAVADTPDKTITLPISYGDDIDAALTEMEPLIADGKFLTEYYPAHWVALKYLEKDDQIVSAGDAADPSLSATLRGIADRVSQHLAVTLKMDPEAMIADHRYGFIRSMLRQGVVHIKEESSRLYLSDRIDQILIHRLAGPAIMVAIVLLLYHLTFAMSEIPGQWLEMGFGALGDFADARMADGMLKSLVISGIIDGVGGVLEFVPIILFMFVGITILEDSGYLARVAFMLDRVFRVFGLHGSSVMPFIVSGGIAGGCAVPGVMAARTLKSPKERLATLLTVPFMNCGAKLPVFALLIGAFFAAYKAWMMLAITILSWGGALMVAWLLRHTIIRGAPMPFIMELPPYRLPTLRGILIHAGDRTWQYIRKAGTVILAISILLWALMSFPTLPEHHAEAYKEAGQDAVVARMALEYSAAGRVGTALEPATQLAGFDWRTNIALVGGFAAKEVIISTLGTAYSLGEVDVEHATGLSSRLAGSDGWRPLTAFSLIIFVMFYSPCFVAMVCIAREAGSWKWAFFSMAFNTVLAFALAVLVFQVGSLLGL